jgi:hypothetical protein
MTTSNQSLLAKADLALSDITANTGLLNPEQANTYIRKLIKSPTIFREARVVSMASPTRKIDKIIFSSRIMRKAVSATALDSTQRAKPSFEQVTLTTDEMIAEVRIPYDVMEDTIERATTANNEASNTGPGGLRDTIIALIGERSALDLEEYCLLADTDSTDDYLAMTDGWLKLVQTGGNVVDAELASIEKKLFKRGKKAMPDQYLRNLASMKHYVSMDNHTEYQDTWANRQTAMGDGAITGTPGLYAYGSPVSAVQQMPEDQGLYLNPMNLIFGVHRDLSMEFDKDITSRVYIIVLTCRIAVQFEENDALVEYTNIASS